MDAQERNKVTTIDATAQRTMALEATKRLFHWIHNTELDIPPQTALDLGIVIGRLRVLEGQ